MRPNQLAALVLVIFLFAFGYLSLHYYAPPAVVGADAPKTEFSAERAMPYLQEIAKEPHSKGTQELVEVEEYLVAQLRQRGLKVTVQDTTAWRGWGYNHRLSRIRNISAFLPGSAPSTTIVVAAHYDSQPNTPGAADDGVACAAMLESIDALQAGDALKNNVLFLFTDNEEFGLLGAEAFVEYYPNMDELGLIINWEARGNRGPSLTFEISPENGWLMREYAKGAAHPIANSMTYEIYKLLPNDTDYTMFREAGVPGINNAFIEGFVNYHSMTDTPENLSMPSFQHHGSNMLSMVRHFGNLDWPENTRAPDVVFFNPIGSWIILYPASYDLWLMIFTGLLLLGIIILGHQRKRFKWPAVLIGTAIFLMALVISLGLVFGVNHLVKTVYPHYNLFYSSNFYNSSWYLWAYAGIAFTVCGLVYKWAFRTRKGLSLGLGAGIIVFFFMLGMSKFLPTGAFMMYVPLISFLLGQLVIILADIHSDKQPISYALIQGLCLMPVLSLWTMLSKATFTAFSLGMPLGGPLAIILIVGLALPALYLIRELHPRWMSYFGLFTTLICLIVAHIQSSPSPERPVQTNLFYQVDTDGSAHWISSQSRLDGWNEQFFAEQTEREAHNYYPGWSNKVWRAPADTHPAVAVDTSIIVDSLRRNGQRDLVIQLKSPSLLTSMRIFIEKPEKILEVRLDGRTIGWEENKDAKRFYLYFMGPKLAGSELRLLVADDTPIPCTIVSRTWGIPQDWLPHSLTDNYIFGPGPLSNSVLVKKEYQF